MPWRRPWPCPGSCYYPQFVEPRVAVRGHRHRGHPRGGGGRAATFHYPARVRFRRLLLMTALVHGELMPSPLAWRLTARVRPRVGCRGALGDVRVSAARCAPNARAWGRPGPTRRESGVSLPLRRCAAPWSSLPCWSRTRDAAWRCTGGTGRRDGLRPLPGRRVARVAVLPGLSLFCLSLSRSPLTGEAWLASPPSLSVSLPLWPL